MVSPMTFRHPAIVAKSAVAVSLLAEGRLELGLGAGWNDYEHQMYGLDYPRYGIRLEMLDEGATVIKALWSGEATSFEGKHYQLLDAVSYPLPEPPPPVIMGGKGEKTLHVVAKHADEWNFTYESPASFLAKSQQLDIACKAIGRDPVNLQRSVMIPCAVGRDALAVRERIDAHHRMFNQLPTTFDDWRAAGFIGGAPDQVVAQIQEFAEAGASRLLLQHNDLDDIGSLELLATDVLPYV
jgi:alkanesulfonate monooxygenase SsuD/methylene tetrahydromethanopterin reductase-like flavin-dependent oxidoreductase (luciferase family)